MPFLRSVLMTLLFLVCGMLNAQTEDRSKEYTEVDFVKMQTHYKGDAEVIEKMKLKSMAGNENADMFLEFLDMSYDQAKLKFGNDVITSVIYTYYESVSLLNRFEELNTELEAVNASANKGVTRLQLSPNQYFEHAKFIWGEMVPSSGQSSLVPGEMLRAVEKLKDEAQRNANVNFHEGCHVRLIRYLRARLMDERLFDPETISRISKDLDRLEREEQPYTDDDIYDRLADRVVDWFLFYGGSMAHEKDPELEC